MDSLSQGIMAGIQGLEAAKTARAPRMPMRYSMSNGLDASYTSGGVADALQNPNAGPDQEALTQGVVAAVAGKLGQEDAMAALAAYASAYGDDALAALIDQVLGAMDMPQQDTGLLAGPGAGMDDQIPAQVSDTGQPVALSSGEFVIPADVVSGLGDGSTEAGARRLEDMMGQVREKRTGTTQQPRPLAEGGGIKM